jgi:hypothetical protein
MIPKASMAGHPDKVFGPDQPVTTEGTGELTKAQLEMDKGQLQLAELIYKLRQTDAASKDSDTRALIADGLHVAAQRIIYEYDKLRAAREQLSTDDQAVRAREAAVEVRELAVQARETLLGLYDDPGVYTETNTSQGIVKSWRPTKWWAAPVNKKARKEPKV